MRARTHSDIGLSHARALAEWNPVQAKKKPKEPAPPKEKPKPVVQLPAANGPHVSVPSSFFLAPLLASIKCVVRPTTALTRRKELEVMHPLPRPLFEDLMKPLKEGDTQPAIKRDEGTGWLLPTKVTPALRHYEFDIRKGSVADRFFCFESLDQPPPPPPPAPEPTAQEGEERFYEVERLVSKKVLKKRVKYLVKWVGYSEEWNTWEYASNINTNASNMVREFEGKPPRRERLSAPLLFKRGVGCARARLSVAEQKRGGVPQTISMVCGNIKVHYKEPVNPEQVPTLRLVFYVMTMDKNGFITWPDNYDSTAQARLREQARQLLRKMIEDPLNPVDETMRPALTQSGGVVWQPPPKRQMVVVPAAQQTAAQQ